MTQGRERIEHIIVLMMENRSFDHMLGYLDHPGLPNLRDLDVSCPVDPAQPTGKRIGTSDDASEVLGADPDHSHESATLQMYGRQDAKPGDEGRMDGFIRSYEIKINDGSLRKTTPRERTLSWLLGLPARIWGFLRRKPVPKKPRPRDIMKCFSEDKVPILSTLAKEYAVLTNWHASVPGETWPNRNFAHAATSDGQANIKPGFYTNATIFDQLTTPAERRWRIYHDGVPQVWVFSGLWLGGRDEFKKIDQLYTDIANDQLQPYSFVEPNHGIPWGLSNSQHPGDNLTAKAGFIAGEQLMADIHNALVARPDVFAKTHFLIVYDEHGGFFDHVPPQPVPSPDDKTGPTGFDFTVTGVRVPAVAISPLIPKGHVDPTFYEHATIPKTVRQQFANHLSSLTRRDEHANDLLANLPLLDTPRADCQAVTAEPPPILPAEELAAPKKLNDLQADILELGGAVKTAIDNPPSPPLPAPPPMGVDPGLPPVIAGPGLPRFEDVPFDPGPAVAEAASKRELEPGSTASQRIEDVVAFFNA
jgi:phospholipase C